jgi:Leucine-rich repeat (LRR) protein
VEWSVPALSPTAAARLQELHLSGTQFQHPIVNIEALRGCTQLRKLSLQGGCRVSDLGPLAGCVHLEELSAGSYGSYISDLAPLVGCAKLKKLWIVGSQVLDLGPLRGCVDLQDLNISDTHVSSLAPLSACAHLKMVYMSGTSVTSVEPLMACSKLEELYIDGLAENPLGLAALVVALPQLRITRR